MKDKITILILLLTAHAGADDSMIQRQWTLPELTPIIELHSKKDPEDPFTPAIPDWKPLGVYNEDQIQSWLQNNGVDFPPNSRLIHTRKKDGNSILKIKNTPRNLELIDFIFFRQYPVHTSLQLMQRFLLETEGKPIGKLLPVIQKYPGQTLGPLRNIVEELQTLEQQLATKPKPKLKEIISARKNRIIQLLPESIQATRVYFKTLVKTMNSAE